MTATRLRSHGIFGWLKAGQYVGRHARITVTNEGSSKVGAFYFNLDYRAYSKPLTSDQLYFHAQYRQAAPAHGWTNQWRSNGDANVNDKKNLNGDGNYVWLDATGHGHFVGS